MSDHRSELEAVIEAAPLDPKGYAVLADHLQELGDPRGELIALSLAHKDREAGELLDKHRDVLGPPPHVEFEWANGYARAIRIDPSNAHAARTALAHPSARFVTELRVYGGMVALGGVIAAIAAEQRPTLRVLQLGTAENRGPVFKFGIHRELGDLSELWDAVPNLEQVELAGSKQVLGTIELPQLTSFTLDTKGLSAETAKAIAKARWPKLQALRVIGKAGWFLKAFKAPPTPPTVNNSFVALLRRKDLPALRVLELACTPNTDELVGAIAASALVARLTELDLSGGTLTDAGLSTLLATKNKLAHLERLDLHANKLTPAGVKRLLKALPFADAGDQEDDNPPVDEPRDDGDEDREPPFEVMPDD